jgi:hypothetical protein
LSNKHANYSEPLVNNLSAIDCLNLLFTSTALFTSTFSSTP